MYLIGLHTIAKGSIHTLMACDRPQAFEGRRDNGREPVASVAFNAEVLARQAGGNNGLEFLRSHDLG